MFLFDRRYILCYVYKLRRLLYLVRLTLILCTILQSETVGMYTNSKRILTQKPFYLESLFGSTFTDKVLGQLILFLKPPLIYIFMRLKFILLNYLGI